MLSTCTGNTIDPDDGLPAIICEECVVYLDMAYDFLVLCQTSEATLRNALNITGHRRVASIGGMRVKEEPIGSDEHSQGMSNVYIKHESNIEHAEHLADSTHGSTHGAAANDGNSDELNDDNGNVADDDENPEAGSSLERSHLNDHDPLEFDGVLIKNEPVFDHSRSRITYLSEKSDTDSDNNADVQTISDSCESSDADDEIFPLIDVVDVVDVEDSETDEEATANASNDIESNKTAEPVKSAAEKIGSKADGIFKRRELLKSIFEKLPMVLNRKRSTIAKESPAQSGNANATEIKLTKYACHLCPEIFTQINDIKEHIRGHNEAVKFRPAGNSATPSDNKSIQYICKFCNRCKCHFRSSTSTAIRICQKPLHY